MAAILLSPSVACVFGVGSDALSQKVNSASKFGIPSSIAESIFKLCLKFIELGCGFELVCISVSSCSSKCRAPPTETLGYGPLHEHLGRFVDGSGLTISNRSGTFCLLLKGRRMAENEDSDKSKGPSIADLQQWLTQELRNLEKSRELREYSGEGEH